MRKWQWVAHKLMELGAPDDLITLCRQIDKMLLELYDLETTYEWQVNLPTIERVFSELPYEAKRNYLFSCVIYSAKYCVACVMHAGKCDECLFAKKAGRCQDPNSLFGKLVHHPWWWQR